MYKHNNKKLERGHPHITYAKYVTFRPLSLLLCENRIKIPNAYPGSVICRPPRRKKAETTQLVFK